MDLFIMSPGLLNDWSFQNQLILFLLFLWKEKLSFYPQDQ